MEISINAGNLILGRLASYAAKKALLGEKILIFNCENAAITGNKRSIVEKYRKKKGMGNPSNGPFIPRMPDRFVRRAIRGMVPHKKPRGKKAFGNIMCYIGVPEKFKDKKMITLPSADVSKTKNLRFMYVKDICSSMGGKL